MDRRTELKSTLRIEDVPTVRAIVAQKLREAIMSGTFKPGQRLVERELCEMTGVSRPSIREALRLLEADGMVSTVPHRGPWSPPSASRKPASSMPPAPCLKDTRGVNVHAFATPPSCAGWATPSPA